MIKVRMYCTRMCPYCVRASRLLDRKGVAVEKIYVDQDAGQRQDMIRITGRTSVPQIFVGVRHVGGFDELSELDADGKLDALLAAD
jgi:glutaredoxin 3